MIKSQTAARVLVSISILAVLGSLFLMRAWR